MQSQSGPPVWSEQHQAELKQCITKHAFNRVASETAISRPGEVQRQFVTESKIQKYGRYFQLTWPLYERPLFEQPLVETALSNEINARKVPNKISRCNTVCNIIFGILILLQGPDISNFMLGD